MLLIDAISPQAKEAKKLVESLQVYFVSKLNAAALRFGKGQAFEAVSWARDEGKHGGGTRYESRDRLFNSASVNVSQVHYDDDDSKKLGSATALSTIIHPDNPHAPSMHMHISWTQMKDGTGYWRAMADLNPSLLDESFEDKQQFASTLQRITGELYEEGIAQGDKYFYIPALQKHRGVCHFYLEGYHGGDFEVDKRWMQTFGEGVIEQYMQIISAKLHSCPSVTEQEKKEQLAYHTLYLFQVLTLDRGTTSGLLVHNQNDVGIMGSIPSHVDKNLLKSWQEKMPKPQDVLLGSLIEELPDESPAPVNTHTKIALANAVRKHYSTYPKALDMQASGEQIPPTVNNHR